MNHLLFWNLVVLEACMIGMALSRARYKIWTAALVILIPGGVFQMAFTAEIFDRKEVFFFTFLSLIGCGLTLARHIPEGNYRSCARFGLMGAVWAGSLICSLIHEAFFFLCAPAAMYLLIACERLGRPGAISAGQSQSELRRAFRFVVAMAVCFFSSSLLFHGGAVMASHIRQALPAADSALLQPLPWGGIEALGLGVSTMWTVPLMAIQTGMAWWYLTPSILLMVYCFGIVALNVSRKDSSGDHFIPWARYYGVLMLFAGPMYLIGWDWGRWTNCISMSFLLIWLSVRDEDLFDPLTRLPFHGLRAWVERHRLVSRLERVFSTGAALVREHPSPTVTCLLLFALTFGLPALFLTDRFRFIGSASADVILLLLHRL